MELSQVLIESVRLAIDAVGVFVIVLSMGMATFRFVVWGRKSNMSYDQYRQELGRGILLGLEFLVAADIIRTVAIEPTLDGVLVLGIIVLIRTFLSMAIEVELDGRWPWQRSLQPVSTNEPTS